MEFRQLKFVFCNYFLRFSLLFSSSYLLKSLTFFVSSFILKSKIYLQTSSSQSLKMKSSIVSLTFFILAFSTVIYFQCGIILQTEIRYFYHRSKLYLSLYFIAVWIYEDSHRFRYGNKKVLSI
jgi:hypothetical protein